MGVATAVYSESSVAYEPAPATGGVPTTRVLTAGAGLTGGGDLSADRTFTVAAADGTITVNADSIEATGTFGAKNVTTTGFVSIGSTVAASGSVRVANAVVALAAKSQGAATISLVGTDASDGVQLGDATNAATLVVQAAGDTTIKRGAAAKVTVGSALVTLADGVIEMGASGPKILKGSGSPEGAITAVVGSVYQRTDGGASTTLYVKESGSGNTGWVAYGVGGAGASDYATDANTLHCWKLDEASGTSFVDSGSAGAGGALTLSGTAIKYQQKGGGPALGAAFYSSSKTFLTGATGIGNRPAGNNITLHGWLRFRNVAATQAIVHRKYTASGGTWVSPFLSIGVFVVTNSVLEFQITTGTDGAGTRTVATTDCVLGVGNVYHFACTYDGTTFLTYVNGEALTSNTLSASIDWNTAVEGPWVIGGVDSNSGDNRMIAVARRVRVESVAMSKATIQAIYNQGIGSV